MVVMNSPNKSIFGENLYLDAKSSFIFFFLVLVVSGEQFTNHSSVVRKIFGTSFDTEITEIKIEKVLITSYRQL